MNKKHWAAGIVHNDGNKIILAKKNNIYSLPKVKISLGLDPVKELKSEIEKEYVIKVKFEHSLALSWSELLQLHSGTVKEFTSYYVFSSSDYSERDHFWVDSHDIENITLEEHDSDALNFFLHN